MLSHLSIQMTLYSVNSINAIPDITFPQFRGLFPLIYERKTSEKISACPPESRKQKKGRTQQERPVPFCSTFAFEKWNILFLVFIGLLGQPSKNPFHFHLKNGTGSFPYSSASPRNVPLVPLFSETLYIDKKEVHRGRENFFIPYIMSYKSGTNGTMLLLPDKLGIFYVPLFELKSGTRTAPASCCTQTQDPNQPPAGRPIPASSGSEMRTCVPAFAFSDALRGVLRHEKARQGTRVPQRA